jgi:hypothetical protein
MRKKDGNNKLQIVNNKPVLTSTSSPVLSNVEVVESREVEWIKWPNFTNTAHMPTSPNGPRYTGHESRFMQNEPNFNLKAPTKHANGTDFTNNIYIKNHQLLLRSAPKNAKKRKKCATFVNFCKSLKLTHLTPCTTKAYMNFYSQLPFKSGVHPQSLWRENMQNEPNFTLTAHMHTFPNRPRTTSDESRLKMQNKPNFQSTASSPTVPNGPRDPSDERRIMQNEPNFNQRAKRFVQPNTQTVQILPPKSICFSSTLPLIYPPKVRTFTQKYTKKRKKIKEIPTFRQKHT